MFLTETEIKYGCLFPEIFQFNNDSLNVNNMSMIERYQLQLRQGSCPPPPPPLPTQCSCVVPCVSNIPSYTHTSTTEITPPPLPQNS